VRRIIKIGVGVALLWSLYWFAAGIGLRGGLSAWFHAQNDAGWQAEHAGMETSGFPFSIITHIKQPALADPGSGVAWQGEYLTLSNPAWWPGNVTLAFPEGPQRFSYFDQTQVLSASSARANLGLKPGPQLEIREMSLVSGPWNLSGDEGSLVGAADIRVSAGQTENPSQYHIEVSARDFSPGEVPRRNMYLPESWPVVFDTLELDGTVTFDRPWDRSALETSRPQPRQISLKLLEAKWGDLRVFAAGDFKVSADGTLDGTFALKADNWRDILNVAERSGALPSSARQSTEQALELLAGLSGNKNALDLRLGLREGTLMLGPVPIGPAPRILLH
jgi:hypothetical protein